MRCRRFEDRQTPWHGRRLLAFLGLSRAGQAALGLAQLSALARILPPSEFALVASAIAISAYLQISSEPAILGYQRLGRHHRSEDFDPSGPRASAAGFLLLWSGFVPVGVVIVALSIGQPLTGLAVAAWAVSLVQIRWVSIQYLNWSDQQGFATTTLVNSLARTSAMISAAWVLQDGAATLLAGALGAWLVTFVGGPTLRPLVLAPGRYRSLMSVGLPLTLSAVAVTSLTNWPTLVGSRELTTEVFAAFAAQSGLASAAYGASIGFMLVFGFPRAKVAWDTGYGQAAHQVVTRYLGYLALGSALLAGIFLFFGEDVTRALLGATYAGRVVPTSVIAVSTLASVSVVASWLLQLNFEQRRLGTIDVSAALAQIPVVWAGTVHFGLPGLLAAMALAQGARAVATVFMSGTTGRWRALLLISFALALLVAMVSQLN